MNYQKRIKKSKESIVNKWVNIFWKFIIDNGDKNWDWNEISRNSNITWDIIKNNLDKDWKWEYMIYNPNITLNMLKTVDIDLNRWKMCENPTITMDDIINNLYIRWNFYIISCKEFTKQKTDFLNEEYHKHLMAFRIQYRWKNALVNPNCQIGIRRIERDMDFAGL